MPNGSLCVFCGKYHDISKRCSRSASRMILVTTLLLALPVLSLAQQSAQNDSATLQLVAACTRGVYDACDLVGGHWYYLKNGIWTRDDGMVGKPPVVPVVPCPADTGKLNQQLLKDLDYRGPWPVKTTNDSPWNLHFWTSSAILLGGTFADWASSRNRRKLGLLRNSTGGLKGKAYWGLNGGLYALSVVIQKRHPKGASVIRDIVGTVHLGDAAHNWAVNQ